MAKAAYCLTTLTLMPDTTSTRKEKDLVIVKNRMV